jgi:hypothetical protein
MAYTTNNCEELIQFLQDGRNRLFSVDVESLWNVLTAALRDPLL